MKGVMWNLWHGCTKYSEGCENCYVYRGDAKRGRDAREVFKTQDFLKPVVCDRRGAYKVPSGSLVWTCFSSDFLLADCDEWRKQAWDVIRERSDCRFFFITKRIVRFAECVPPDWGDGWDNVSIAVTCENQRQAEVRLPVFAELPIKRKHIVTEPLLGPLDLTPWLNEQIYSLTAGGESGAAARPCDYAWITALREQCVRANVSFRFKQTGAKLIKDEKLYPVERKLQHAQARKASIDFSGLHGWEI